MTLTLLHHVEQTLIVNSVAGTTLFTTKHHGPAATAVLRIGTPTAKEATNLTDEMSQSIGGTMIAMTTADIAEAVVQVEVAIVVMMAMLQTGDIGGTTEIEIGIEIGIGIIVTGIVTGTVAVATMTVPETETETEIGTVIGIVTENETVTTAETGGTRKRGFPLTVLETSMSKDRNITSLSHQSCRV